MVFFCISWKKTVFSLYFGGNLGLGLCVNPWSFGNVKTNSLQTFKITLRFLKTFKTYMVSSLKTIGTNTAGIGQQLLIKMLLLTFRHQTSGNDCTFIELDNFYMLSLTLILMETKLTSLCRQNRARPACTSMQPNQALYCWLTVFNFSFSYL